MWLVHLLLPLLTATVLCEPQDDTVAYRLPTIYVPINYQVHLNLSESAFTELSNEYSGIVSINFTVTEGTKDVQLHASHLDLQINTIVISGKNIDALDYSIDAVTDILHIFYPVGLVPGQYDSLTIHFTGNLSEDMDGFFKSTYKDSSGTTRYLASTQFETISARRAFPCFDEPAFKATFDIFITHPLGYNAISNTPGSIYASDSVSETIRFETTPIMSTYLLAFVISDFTCSKAVSSDGVIHQVCSRNDTSNARNWGLEMGPKVLDVLANFTRYPFADVMKKMDQGAILGFGGAMENWGLVLYGEGYLLWDSEKNSNSEKQNVATTIAHEFSHQWFGDLVTLGWWSEVFLNEGFATYCEFHIAHEVLPEWHLDEQFVVDVLQEVLIDDSYGSEQALESDVLTPSDISRKFGDISYYKGGSIIRMVDHFMGRENFIAGIRNYIDINKFGNAVPDDLWNALNGKVNNLVTKMPDELPVIMDTWTMKAGYPLLQVSVNGSQITITQERFLLNLKARDESTKWFVPITYTTSVDANKFTDTAPSTWLTPESNLMITIPENASWIILNNQQSGYYRVNYDDTLWSSISEALQKEDFDGIGELNRAQIVDDLFSLARADKIEYSKVLDLVEFLAHDTSFLTWRSAFRGFVYLLNSVGRDTDLGQSISNQILRLMTALYESSPASKPNPSDQIYTLKRELAATWACQLGNQDCVEYSLTMFAKYKNEGAKLDNDLKYVIYCNGLRYSTDDSDWDFMWNVYENASADERWYLTRVLACSPHTEVLDILDQYLHRIIGEKTGLRLQDAKSAFAAVYNENPKGVDLVFRFLINNYDALAKRFQSMGMPGVVLKNIAAQLTTYEQIRKLKEAIESNKFPTEFHSAAITALEIAETNIQWIEEFEDEIKEYYDLI